MDTPFTSGFLFAETARSEALITIYLNDLDAIDRHEVALTVRSRNELFELFLALFRALFLPSSPLLDDLSPSLSLCIAAHVRNVTNTANKIKELIEPRKPLMFEVISQNIAPGLR